ncbi:FtsX-like permease family protein [Olsenella profusa]|uniref:FtsX-like permease family protein n=1 Tax=Olsenella profusa TaxID=138595 RepID=A0ABS2F0J4_9ACTN|nr:FtsX-like permease family protein [Olsenella profusa]MBM6774340.1 FtsX-like permease family protein [Olsenella profusa]
MARRTDTAGKAGRARRGAARSAFSQGVLRTVRGSLKRFLALATITALGVTMLVGLRAACADLRASADAFFDEQNLLDVRVQSTLGLSAEDVDALAALPGVEAAEGGWSETVYTTVGSASEKVDVKALSPDGMNAPVVLEGHLPERDDQIAVTKRFLEDSGLYVGDTVTFHGADDDAEDATEVFERKEYTIIAVVLDPMEINAGEGTMSFRSSGGSQYSFFVLPDCVEDPDTFTVAYLSVEGADTPLCYSVAYEDVVDGVYQSVEDARSERERARGESLRADATAEVDKAEDEALSELADAQAQIDDGQAELDSGRAELSEQEDAAHRELADAQAQIDDGYAQLDAAQAELDARRTQVEDGLAQIASGLGTTVDGIPSALSSTHDTLVSSRASLETTAAMISSLAGGEWPADAWAQISSAATQAEREAAAAVVDGWLSGFVSQGTSAIDQIINLVSALPDAEQTWERLPEEVRQKIAAIIEQLSPELQQAIHEALSVDTGAVVSQLTSLRDMLAQMGGLGSGMAQVAAGEAQLSEARSGYQTLIDARSQIQAGQDQIDAGRAELDAGATELSDQRSSALAQIADGWDQLESGQAELDDARATYESERADALDQIADARAEVEEIPDATWYVQDRSSLASYASVDSDASSIEAIGTVIPVVFFVVAVLISLTTMTRMVEEERGLIGVYKALGYGRGKILSKYALYALAACLAGGVVGIVLGFVVLPAIIFTIFSTMYALPEFLYGFDAVWALVSVALFALGIVGASLATCWKELRESPASLMRPKAPKAGSRIFLEHIGPVWRRLGFLNKVTARNLFRYKRRFLMTVFGIAGCVALLVTGFGIRDTVLSLSPRQYGEQGVVAYDLMAVTDADDLDDAASELAADDGVADLVRVYVDSVTLSFGGDKESVQLVVVPDGESLEGCVNLVDDAGERLALGGDVQVAVTKNAEQVTGLGVGDELSLQDSTLAEGTTSADAIVLNYLGNTIFMTQSAYEEAFGRELEPNGLLAHLTGSADEQIELSERLSQDGRWLSVVSTQKLVNDFSSAFTLINTVVYVVIVLAAALSFTVVFTLSNTNISERERELATIKVLGFRAPEVHRYINKETLILTGIGVVVGLPVGYFLARSLTWILRMPSLYFDVVVDPVTYVISAVLAFAFTLVVNLMTNRSLNRIDMVGALKSAE